jgi:leucyl aminopeptidase
VISLESSVPHLQQVVSLAEAQNRSREWANGRGDVEAIPAYFLRVAEKLVKKHQEVELTAIRGKQLLDEGFRLMHAVGRASVNEPIFVNLAYKGDPTSDEWVAFVGKGVCFDTGGYNIKSSTYALN